MKVINLHHHIIKSVIRYTLNVEKDTFDNQENVIKLVSNNGFRTDILSVSLSVPRKNGGKHEIYPSNSKEFMKSIQELMHFADNTTAQIQI